MNEPLREAELLEELLPEALRSLFPGVDDEPLNELPLSQMRVMRQLWKSSRTSSELAGALGVSPPAVAQLVAKLESAGLVVKTCHKEDRRLKTVELSLLGRERMGERRRSRSVRAAEVLAQVDPRSREALLLALQGLIEATGGTSPRGAGLV